MGGERGGGVCNIRKKTPRRRRTVTSSLNEMSKESAGNRMVVRWRRY
jgi:hypothetical protein